MKKSWKPHYEKTVQLKTALNDFDDYLSKFSKEVKETEEYEYLALKAFKEFSPELQDIRFELYPLGQDALQSSAAMIYHWAEERILQMHNAERWLTAMLSIAAPPLAFFLDNMHDFSKSDAVKVSQFYLKEITPDLLRLMLKSSLKHYHYEVAKISLAQWRKVGLGDNWQDQFAESVFEPIIKASDYTSLSLGPGLKPFIDNNLSLFITTAPQGIFGTHRISAAPLSFISALKNSGFSEYSLSLANHRYQLCSDPEKNEYDYLIEFGLEIDRDSLLNNMCADRSPHRWLESLRLLLKRGELIHRGETSVPILQNKQQKFASSSLPGLAVSMDTFVNTLKEACLLGEKSRASALHYINEILDADDALAGRLIEAGLPSDFLQLGKIRDTKIAIDLGL